MVRKAEARLPPHEGKVAAHPRVVHGILEGASWTDDDSLQELGRLGRSGRATGEFHWLHQVSVDSRGNIYTAEVDTGKRAQKFEIDGRQSCFSKDGDNGKGRGRKS